MHQSIRLGRVAGITIGANWSVIVIGWLLTWGLASQLLPRAVEDQSVAAYWLVAASTVVLFFASLVTHELGHSLVALRHGVQVRSITLWLFGGVAQLEHDTTSPSTEVKVAATGPLVSASLAIVFAVFATVLGGVAEWRLLSAALGWLAWINLLLAAFNVLPAFPLDGGRVLRGVLWHRWKDRVRATTAAAAVGTVFAYTLIVLGIVAFTAGLAIDGIWFVLLGWFLLGAARNEAAAVERDELLGDVTVADVMSRDPVVVTASTTVAHLVEHELLRHRHSAYPVVTSGGRVSGLITLDRVRAVPKEQRDVRTVGEAALPLDRVVVTTSDGPATELFARLGADESGRALVVDGETLVGIVAHADLVRALALRSVAA